MSVCKLFTFFVIWCFVVTKTTAEISLVKTLLMQEQYKDSQVYFDHESEKNGVLLYMLCHRSVQNVSCTIFREQHYIDKLPRISPCNVTFKLEFPYVRIGETVRVLPLNPNKALILWVVIGVNEPGFKGMGEASSPRYTIVDFDTCKTAETIMKSWIGPSIGSLAILDYPVGEFIVKSAGFAFYDKECDISFHDWRCDTGFCRLRIDKYTGKVSSDIDFWYKQELDTIDILPKNPQNPKEGNFFFGWKDGAIYEKNDWGLEYFPNDYYHDTWQKFRYSVRDHFITVCKEIEETRVKCDQIDYNGTITMQANFDLQKKNLAPVPYTLRGGGFLLLTTECASNCTESATNQVYKVDTGGKRSKLIDIKGFNCNVNEFTHWHKIFENEQGNLCVSLLCYHSKRSEEGYFKSILGLSQLQYIYFNTPEELHLHCLTKFNF